MNRLFFSGAIGVVMILLSCTKPCHESNYSFLVNESFSPEKDSVAVSDTIWLNWTIQKKQIDINTHAQLDFLNPDNLGADIIISSISDFNNSNRGAVEKFNYVSKTGKIYPVSWNNTTKNNMQLSFKETNEAFVLAIGLIPQYTGAYIITIPDVTGVSRNGNYKCGLSNFSVINTNSNKHLYLFENMWGQSSQYDNARSYCIKVY